MTNPPEDEWAVDLVEDDDLLWDEDPGGDHHALVDLVNRLLDKGVVITGEVTISVAGVELVYLGLNAVLTSVATARRHMAPRLGPPSAGREPPRVGGPPAAREGDAGHGPGADRRGQP